MECPGCGMQRSILELLRGNFVESFKLYPALLPIMFTFVFLGLHLKNKYTNGASVLRYSYIFSTAVVVIAFIVKQVHLFNH